MTEKNFCITLVKLSSVALWDKRGISEGLGFLPTSEICPASHRVQADRFTETLFSKTVEGNPLIDRAYQMVSAA